MSFRSTQPATLVSLLNDAVKPIVLLGAGASKQSGIRLATEIVDEIAKAAYCKENGISLEDPRLTMSDWKKWLEKQSWYNPDYSQLYPIIVDELLNPRQVRKDFFIEITHPDIPASRGYEVIAELMHLRMLDTIITTNFDNCLQNARTQIRRPTFIQDIKTPSDLNLFLYSPRYPQQLFLHGSVEHYTDQNLRDEVKNLNADVVTAIKPLLKERPIIVIGYRGAEPSIMHDLFDQNLSYTSNFSQGIYWCLLKRDYEKLSSDESILSPALRELAAKVKNNFHFVPIDGFDELFVNEIWGRLRANEIDLKSVTVAANSSIAAPPDGKVIVANTIGATELPLIRERVTNYCARLNIKVHQEDQWLFEQMVRLNIAERDAKGTYELTLSGLLLFSSNLQNYLPQANVILRFKGEEDWLKKILSLGSNQDVDVNYEEGTIERKIGGNIWNQLNEITEVLTLVNKPFRLKGEVSENVFPYPTLALKEIIVNCLVHRDYGNNEPALIEVHKDFIAFVSPGGLVEEVKRQLLQADLEDEIRKGRRGIKGYRNPVLADLFYGAGAMDKEGSGLSDVLSQVNINNGTVTFGPTNDEKFFEVRIYRRQEEVDEQTTTATPIKVNEVSRFACNLFEFLSIPQVIYHGETTHRTKSSIFKTYGEGWVPPFLLHRERMWSFYDLSDRANPLSKCVDAGTVETLGVDEFIAMNGGTNEFVRMINECLIEHLFSRGLRVDKEKKRAYFTKDLEGNAKEITYQGRFKRATRTVAKPRINQVTGKAYYWEHKSIWFSVNKFGDTWYLCLNPSYVFTMDGVKSLLKSERVTVLSTRKASRDYNQHVHNDLTFWANYISNASAEAFMLRPNIRGENKEAYSHIKVPEIIVSSKLPTITINDISINSDFIPSEEFDIEEVERELEELAEEEQQKIENNGDAN